MLAQIPPVTALEGGVLLALWTGEAFNQEEGRTGILSLRNFPGRGRLLGLGWCEFVRAGSCSFQQEVSVQAETPLLPAAGFPHHQPHLLLRSRCFPIAEPSSLDKPALRKTGGSRLTHWLVLLLSEIRRD